MNKIIKFCKENCGCEVTKKDIMNDVLRCNFCDVAYILINHPELEGEI